ncbi:DUF1579 family protein [Catenuloplanes japonicus]|uniref:DUF1579 family protein n=1 Tax=Catenuloplanes japonicus TaxID=33876 RepID=UPI000526C9DC|nr:DUF1579 family protein [Catenuloplanes japonicus]
MTVQAKGFDFLAGRWRVTNIRPDGEFPGTAECRPLFGGAGNVEEIDFPTRGFRGATLRLYDPARDEWTLHWADSRTGRLALPMTGRFGADGTGVFHGEDEVDGVRVGCRFVWSVIGPDTARWEQAYADDQGTWETNWIMQFVRIT